jgi:hypothetical protein
MTFQKIVLTTAIVILIFALIIIGILLYNKQYDIKFPPEVGNCPDYYVSAPKGVCKNEIGIKTLQQSCDSVSFKNFKNKDKCQWANGCGVTWDGITNQTPPLC